MMNTSPPVRFLQIPDGAAGTRETLKMMRDLVREAKCDPRLRLLALRLVAAVPAKDFLGEVAAVFTFVQQRVRYTLDINAIEVLQRPIDTLTLGAGDCDDATTAVVSLLEILGHPCYLCAVGFDEPDSYSHVFALVDPAADGEVIALDATEPHPPGWGPPRPVCFLVAPIEG